MRPRLPEEYIDAARLRANRYMAFWDAGSAGSLAADVRRLLWEREALIKEVEDLKSTAKPLVIGFAGHAGSGKNAAAEALGGVVIGFADPLYQGLAAMLGMPEQLLRERATKELPAAVGKSPRDLLRTLGTEWGRELVRDDLWVWRARQRIQEAARLGFSTIAICDVRFANESKFIRDELGGQVWWIDRPNTCPGGHVSDKSITADDCDLVVGNSGTLEQLAWKIRAHAAGFSGSSKLSGGSSSAADGPPFTMSGSK